MSRVLNSDECEEDGIIVSRLSDIIIFYQHYRFSSKFPTNKYLYAANVKTCIGESRHFKNSQFIAGEHATILKIDNKCKV